MLHGLGEEGDVRDLVVELLVDLRVHVVPEADGPQVVVGHHGGAAQHVGEQDLAQVDLKNFTYAGTVKCLKALF